jgi:hypothetical protein
VIDNNTKEKLFGFGGLFDSIQVLAIYTVFFFGILFQTCYDVIFNILDVNDLFLLVVISIITIAASIHVYYKIVKYEINNIRDLWPFFWRHLVFFGIVGISFALCFKIIPGIIEKASIVPPNYFLQLIIKAVECFACALALFVGTDFAFRYVKNH